MALVETKIKITGKNDMDGFKRVEVIFNKGEDGLSRTCFSFYLGRHYGKPFGVHLDTYGEQTRQTKRHKWKSNSFWSRLDKRNSNIEKPDVDEIAKQEAIDQFRQQINFVE